MNLPPDVLEELLAGYVLGNLEPEELVLVQKLLTEQPELEQVVEELQVSLTGLAFTPLPVMPPVLLQDKIFAEFDQSLQPPKRSLGLLPWFVAGMAAVLALGLGLDNLRVRQLVQDNQVMIALLQQPATRLVALQGIDRTAQASGSLISDANTKKAVLILQNLPALPLGQAYHLWALVDGKPPIAYARFNTTAQAKAVVSIVMPAVLANLTVAHLAITAESVAVADAPKGPKVLLSVELLKS